MCSPQQAILIGDGLILGDDSGAQMSSILWLHHLQHTDSKTTTHVSHKPAVKEKNMEDAPWEILKGKAAKEHDVLLLLPFHWSELHQMAILAVSKTRKYGPAHAQEEEEMGLVKATLSLP